MSPRTRLCIPKIVIAGVAAAVLAAWAGAAPAQGAPATPPPGFSARALAAHAEAELTAGHPGAARLDWERARLLAPRSPAVAAGLEKARAAAGLVESRPPAARRLAQWLTSNEWAWLGAAGLACFASALVAFGWGLLGRGARWSLLAGGAVVASLCFVAAYALAPSAGRAVVVAPEVVARIAPFAQAEAAFPLPEGALVTIRRAHGDYALVAGPGGEGWVPRAGVETILPATERHL